MRIINLTPHPINITHEANFLNLEIIGSIATADSIINKSEVKRLGSEGWARLEKSTHEIDKVLGIRMYKTRYGAIDGIDPDLFDTDDLLIVTPLTKLAAAADGMQIADRMIVPHGVVWNRDRLHLLGCTGFTS